MSSLAGCFNASSTLFTIDFYQKLHPRASQRQLVWWDGSRRIAMVLIGLLWIPVIQGAQGCTATCRACRVTWRRQLPPCSSSVCS
jgi:SSS family solute:Na+ symporter